MFHKVKMIIVLMLLVCAIPLGASAETGDDTTKVERRYQAGLTHFENGRIFDAISMWEETAKINPDYNDLKKNLAAAYKFAGIELYGQNRQAEAIEFWQRALELDPENSDIKDYIDRARGEEDALAELSGFKKTEAVPIEKSETKQAPSQSDSVQSQKAQTKQADNDEAVTTRMKSLADSLRILSQEIDSLKKYQDSISRQPAKDDFHLTGYIAADALSDLNEKSLSFEINQVELNIHNNLSDRAFLNGDIDYAADDSGEYHVDIEQAFVSFRPGEKSIWWVTLGKFNAPLGFESLDAPGRPTLSHSLINDYGTPANLTGLMVAAEILPGVSWLVYVVNGWDKEFDLDDTKIFGSSLRMALGNEAEFGLAVITGDESDTTDSRRRTVFDIDLTADLTPYWTLSAEYNRGLESDAAADSSNAEWNGLQLLCRFEWDSRFSLAVRFDWFDDIDGLPTGYSQQLKSLTAAPSLDIIEGLTLRLEGRYDFSDSDVFVDVDGVPQSDRFSAGLRVIGTF